MKKLALAIFVLTFLVPLRADQELKNTDFADGISHWEGDGESAADAGNSDAGGIPDPNAPAPTGVVIKLSPHNWTKIAQEFRPLQPNGVLTVVYKFSDDLAFSTDPEDYNHVPQKMGYGAFKPFHIKPGKWVALFIETAHLEMDYYKMKSQPGSAVQTSQCTIKGLVPREDKIVALAFPPGTGMVTILHVGLDNT
jgi:hypothetical protein